MIPEMVGRHCRLHLVLTVVLLFFVSFPSPVYAWQGRVVRVIDGDTITVQRKRTRERIRLYGIDAPERDQAGGRGAEKYLARLIQGRLVNIKPVARDRYGRTVALVTCGGVNVNRIMIREGYAWVYGKYCRKRICGKWKKLEQQARNEGKGLWAGNDPVPPWQWRRHERPLTDRIVDFTGDFIRWMKRIRRLIARFVDLL